MATDGDLPRHERFLKKIASETGEDKHKAWPVVVRHRLSIVVVWKSDDFVSEAISYDLDKAEFEKAVEVVDARLRELRLSVGVMRHKIDTFTDMVKELDE